MIGPMASLDSEAGYSVAFSAAASVDVDGKAYETGDGRGRVRRVNDVVGRINNAHLNPYIDGMSKPTQWQPQDRMAWLAGISTCRRRELGQRLLGTGGGEAIRGETVVSHAF